MLLAREQHLLGACNDEYLFFAIYCEFVIAFNGAYRSYLICSRSRCYSMRNPNIIQTRWVDGIVHFYSCVTVFGGIVDDFAVRFVGELDNASEFLQTPKKEIDGFVCWIMCKKPYLDGIFDVTDIFVCFQLYYQIL